MPFARLLKMPKSWLKQPLILHVWWKKYGIHSDHSGKCRAGEAGRGFAVVAEEIRKLSEETRQSTEKVAGIVQELGQHAQDATEIVTSSIDAMSKQNGMVEEIADNFGSVRDNIDVLAQRVEDINHKIENLVESNNGIIDNIHQLSESSEQVSSSAKEVRYIVQRIRWKQKKLNTY